MNNFWTIFEYELMQFVKKKSFVIFTLVFALIIAGALFTPRILESLDSPTATPEPEPPAQEQEDVVTDNFDTYIINSDDSTFSWLQASLSEIGINAEQTDKSLDEITKSIENGDYQLGLTVSSVDDINIVLKNRGIYDSNVSMISSMLTQYYKIDALSDYNVPQEEAATILNTGIYVNTIELGVDQSQTYMYTQVITFLLYFLVLFYGQIICMGVATEKSSRAMELLVTSAKPNALLFGKVFATALAGLLQLIVILGSTVISYNFNKAYFADIPIIDTIFGISPEILIYSFVFFILGFFLYAFLYGAAASFASKVEDVSGLAFPITIIFIISFFIVSFSMSSGSTDNSILSIASFVPFTSPMAMLTRLTMGEATTVEALISIAILCVSVWLIGMLAAKIYRAGVLMYGNSPNIKTIINSLKNSK